MESGANNCIFIKTTLADPTELVSSIFSDVYESETAKSRYIMRLLPVIGTCKCNEEKIKKLAEDVLKAHFTDAIGHTFSVNIKVRNNNTMGRKQILPLVVDVVKDMNPANHPDLDHPEYIVNVDILRTVLCLSVLKDSVKFRKYNLQEVASSKSATKAATEGPVTKEKASDDKTKLEDAQDKQDETTDGNTGLTETVSDCNTEKNTTASEKVNIETAKTSDLESKDLPDTKDTFDSNDENASTQDEQKCNIKE